MKHNPMIVHGCRISSFLSESVFLCGLRLPSNKATEWIIECIETPVLPKLGLILGLKIGKVLLVDSFPCCQSTFIKCLQK